MSGPENRSIQIGVDGQADVSNESNSRRAAAAARLKNTGWAGNVKNRIKGFGLALGTGLLVNFAPDEMAAGSLETAARANKPPESAAPSNRGPAPVEVSAVEFPTDQESKAEAGVEQKLSAREIQDWVDANMARYFNPNVTQRYRGKQSSPVDLADPEVQKTLADLKQNSPKYYDAISQRAAGYLEKKIKSAEGTKIILTSKPLLEGKPDEITDRNFEEILIGYAVEKKMAAVVAETKKSRAGFIASSIEDDPGRYDFAKRPDFHERMNDPDPETRGFSIKGLSRTLIAGLLNRSIQEREGREVLRDDDPEVEKTLAEAQKRWDANYGDGTFDNVVAMFSERQTSAIRLMNPGREVFSSDNPDRISAGYVRGWGPIPGSLVDVIAFNEGFQGVSDKLDTKKPDFRRNLDEYQRSTDIIFGKQK